MSGHVARPCREQHQLCSSSMRALFAMPSHALSNRLTLLRSLVLTSPHHHSQRRPTIMPRRGWWAVQAPAGWHEVIRGPRPPVSAVASRDAGVQQQRQCPLVNPVPHRIGETFCVLGRVRRDCSRSPGRFSEASVTVPVLQRIKSRKEFVNGAQMRFFQAELRIIATAVLLLVCASVCPRFQGLGSFRPCRLLCQESSSRCWRIDRQISKRY